MEALCFDVKAPFASFRIPSTTRGFMTFPIPPRTTILGLLGSILGVKRNELYLNDHYLYKAKIAVQILHKATTMNFRTNQIQTRYLKTLGRDVKIYIPGKLTRGVRSPQTIVLLTNVQYRLFVSINNHDRFNEIERRLKEHRYVYPPYLGRANYLASIDYVDKVRLEELKDIKGSVEIISICASNTIKTVETGDYTLITNVPMSYKAETIKNEIKLKPALLANIIYSTKPLNIKTSSIVHRIVKTNLEDIEGKNFIFLPFN
ncbi:MAG: type I-B CRISPR-associated protein Cas5b [Candidatus Hodarchaeales archaeon]